MSLIKQNHLLLETSINELIRNGLEIIYGNYHIKGSKEKIVKEMMIESFLLRSCAYWEYFLEKEIVLLIRKKTEPFKNYYELSSTTVINSNLIRAILMGDRYRDFHDISSLKTFFGKILHPSVNPFDILNTEQLGNISFTYALRNYLSHYSEYSRKKLTIYYVKKYDYRSFIEPGRFLIKKKGIHFEKLLHNFVLISVTMRNNLGV